MNLLSGTEDKSSKVKLNNGVEIPLFGYGTRAVKEGEKLSENGAAETVKAAIESGYRCIDTAARYGNEEAVGEGIKNCHSKREELFITTKLSITEYGYDNTRKAFEASLKRLQLDYADLYLIHWPVPRAAYFDWKNVLLDTWRALEVLYKENAIRAIGVCNCLPEHLACLLDYGEIKPAVNQIEFHPGFTQFDTIRFCAEYDILVQGWSPLGQGGLLKMPLLCEMADKYGVSAAQLCIRFALQHAVMPIVKTTHKERMLLNFDVLNFQIAAEDMIILDAVPLYLIGPHPGHGYIHG